MTGDLWALAAAMLLATLQLTLSSVLTLRQLGGIWVAGSRDEPRAVTGVSGRFVRAYRNLLEIFPQFVAALFLVHAAHAAGSLSVIGAWVFVIARLLYVPAYAFAPPRRRLNCLWPLNLIAPPQTDNCRGISLSGFSAAPPSIIRLGGAVCMSGLPMLDAVRLLLNSHEKPARCQRSDPTGVRCRSTAGSWSRECLFFRGCRPEPRNGSCWRAGSPATRCRPGSPPA